MDVKRIEHLGLDRVLSRGSGEIIVEEEDALFIRDSVSGAYFLACDDAAIGIPLLERYLDKDCDLLMIANSSIANAAFVTFGFKEKIECYQVAYYGKRPSNETELTFRTADLIDLEMLVSNYRLISPAELEQVVKRGSVLLGYYQNKLVGFIGEHLEGSMGMLYVFPEYRRRGFGAALQSQMIATTMEKGYIPFGQVEKSNHASLQLQKKLGMTLSDKLIVWMWK